MTGQAIYVLSRLVQRSLTARKTHFKLDAEFRSSSLWRTTWRESLSIS